MRDHETRIRALWEWDEERRATTGETQRKGADTFEYFAAGHRSIRVLRCPQPGLPEAWLVWWRHDFKNAHAILNGPDPESYPPSTIEAAQRIEAERLLREREDVGIVWKPGDPWLESVGIFLTDSQGRLLSEYQFMGCGVIADVDGDGMLDRMEFSRARLTNETPSVEEDARLADLIESGPVDAAKPRSAAWLCNLGRRHVTPERSFRFDIRERAGTAGLDLILVPQMLEDPFDEADRGELILRPGATPSGSDLVALDPSDLARSMRRFAKERFGWQFSSVGQGGQRASELRVGEPKKETLDTAPGIPFSVPPGIAALSPAEAALAHVEHNRDDTHRERFDLVLEPPPPDPPDSGWVEVVVEPGWADSSLSVWWLREDGAECWTCSPKDGATAFAVSEVSREPLAHWIALLAHLDRVRTVPRGELPPDLEHDRMGGADHTVVTIRLGMVEPSSLLVDFEPAIPTLWQAIRGPYDRPAAAVLAVVLGTAPPAWDVSGNFETRPFPDVVETWLDPEIVSSVPPPLVRHVIRAVGMRGKEEFRPRLEALLRHWGPASPGEEALAKARVAERMARHAMWTPPYDSLKTARRRLHFTIAEVRDLEARQATDTPSQLRETVEAALRMLDSGDDPVRLEAWAKEVGDLGAEWARRRLGSVEGQAPAKSNL
ncbi:MAG: hypothetical protein GXX91_12730 [Verrucomicrobiaceae bacterium]|nr:hypothetical protein [Verrucomicrobiaceae bacterium]